MENLPSELLIEIFKYIDTPISLILVNKEFHRLYTSPVAKSLWALSKFGRIHVLFYSILLGKTFITVDVLNSLLALKANLSRYFVQRLLLQYGKYDEELIKLKLQDNNNNSQETDRENFKAFQNSIKTPWSSEISFDVFIALLNEAEARFGPNLPLKGNDIEKFHFLSSGQLPIDQAARVIKENLDEIRDLIVNQKFTPFSPRPKIKFEDTSEYFRTMQIINKEEFPAKDGYENNRHLHIIARAILLENSIIDMWKEIGYYDICRDVNDLVIQGCILRLFPLNTPVGWNDPSKKIVVNQLRDLIRVGFKLTKAAMVNILCFCENRLDTIGDSIMLESFCEVRNEPKIDIIQKCLIEMTQADREVKSKVLDFLRRDKNGRGLDSVFLKTIVCHLFDFDTETKGKFDDLEKKEEISLSSSSNSKNIKIQNTEDNNFNHQTTGDNTYIRKNSLDNNSIRQNSVDNKSVHQNSVDNNPICQNVDNNFIAKDDIDDKDDKDTSSSIEEEVNDDYFINCQNLLYDNINQFINSNIENPINRTRTLTLRSSLYNWILINFNANSIITRLCFHDIILSKVWIDIESMPYHSKKTPVIIKNFAEKILSTYDDYCKHHVPFETFHLQLLRKSNEATTLKPFFDIFLPRVFNIEPITHQYEEAKKDDDNNDRSHNNSQLNNMDSDKKIWFHELKKEYNLIFDAANDFTDLYKENIIMIHGRIIKTKVI